MVAVNWTNITTAGDLLKVPNTTTGGSFWSATLWLLWIIILIAMSAFGFEVALLVSAFFGIIAGALLVYAGLVSWAVVLFFIGQLIFTILYIVWSSNKN